MDNIDPSLTDLNVGSAPNPSPSDLVDTRILRICQYIRSENLTPKKFLQVFLNSPDMDLASLRCFWGTKTGWPSTLSILDTIKRLTSDSDGGLQRWQDWILKEVG